MCTEERIEHEANHSLSTSSLRCLLAILSLSKKNRQIASRSIAEVLCVKPPSVCRILDILMKEGLIQKEPYGKVELTACGKRTAMESFIKVRKIQSILGHQLGLGKDECQQAAIYFVTTLDEKSQLGMIAHAAAIKGGDPVMPLNLASMGEENIIRKIGGTPEVKKHLSDLGFVVGGTVSVVTQTNGNLIVNVKESRIAISKEMAQRIMI